jgi:inward rectifier potassium channel
MASPLRRKPKLPRAERVFPDIRTAPKVRRVTDRGMMGLDVYHTLLTMNWSAFFGLLAIVFVVFNVVFALLFLLQPGAIANAQPGAFADAFFFSVQTMATIGYGQLYPQSLYANLVITVEVLLSMAGLALATGLIFARFSRPTARVMFSRVAVIASQDGVPTFMFRAANQRRNLILEAQVSLSLLRNEVTAEGVHMRRFHDLAVARRRTPAFSLTWTVLHPIDEASPLFGATPESLQADQIEIVVTLMGIDETYAQTVYARHSYIADEIAWNRRFADILDRLADGSRIIDYRRFHDLEEMKAEPSPPAGVERVG